MEKFAKELSKEVKAILDREVRQQGIKSVRQVQNELRILDAPKRNGSTSVLTLPLSTTVH